MSNSATNLARELLGRGKASLEVLAIHQFRDDAEAHDDEAIERLYLEFKSKFKLAQSELSGVYGDPIRAGNGSDNIIPLNGIVCYAIWQFKSRLLYLAFAHEDRGVPILLMLGTILQ